MTRILLPLFALFTLATPAAATAASDGTSNTLMVAEVHQRPGFMDYTDDVAMVRVAQQPSGGR